MIQYLISQGWIFSGTCNCAGNPKWYDKDGWRIKVFAKRWELYKGKEAIIQGKDNQLQEGLKQYTT